MIVGWSPIEKRVMDAVEDYLESCAQVKVDIEVVESLLRPENLEVSLRYVLKHATRRGSNIFQLFDTSESRTTLWQAEDVGWRVREETVHGKGMGKTSGITLGIRELGRAKASPCSRQNPTSAPASGKLVISWGRRRPLGLNRRQAKAKGCLRKPGQGNAEVH